MELKSGLKIKKKKAIDVNNVLQKLKGGDLRSIGRANEIAEAIIRNHKLFPKVFDGMLHDDPIVRMRSADALEKVSSKYPEYLQPFKIRLIKEVSQIKQQEVRWHVAQMFSYLELTKMERDEIIQILFLFINTTKSNIVKTFSMQTLSDFAMNDKEIKPLILKKMKEMIKTGSPAVVKRGKKLIDKLENKTYLK